METDPSETPNGIASMEVGIMILTISVLLILSYFERRVRTSSDPPTQDIPSSSQTSNTRTESEGAKLHVTLEPMPPSPVRTTPVPFSTTAAQTSWTSGADTSSLSQPPSQRLARAFHKARSSNEDIEPLKIEVQGSLEEISTSDPESDLWWGAFFSGGKETRMPTRTTLQARNAMDNLPMLGEDGEPEE